FLDTYDSIRRDSYPAVLESLARAARSLPDPQLQTRLQQLCSEVQHCQGWGHHPAVPAPWEVLAPPSGVFQVQRGSQPRVAQLCAVRSVFSGSALALNQLQVSHVKALSRVLFLTPHLPAPVLRHRLRSHVLEIRQLDRALQRLSLGQLREEELRAACYVRGLNSTHLDVASCRAWLEQWLGLSCRLEASEASLLANSMVLLSLNYARPK
ncbi:LTMD1 protein, partial [Eolophus roseicapillus]|nr:LTMD1 protein [Eolophus roseicapilla]